MAAFRHDDRRGHELTFVAYELYLKETSPLPSLDIKTLHCLSLCAEGRGPKMRKKGRWHLAEPKVSTEPISGAVVLTLSDSGLPMSDDENRHRAIEPPAKDRISGQQIGASMAAAPARGLSLAAASARTCDPWATARARSSHLVVFTLRYY
jgi:hypothetical protein